ncbi:MAG: endopeptidase La [Bdellovibrionota bacterium]
MEEKNLPVVVARKPKNIVPKPTKSDSEREKKVSLLKILPVKYVVLFPHNVMPLTAGKEWTSESVDRAVRIGGSIGILAFKDDKSEISSPEEDLFSVGTEAKILKIIRFPDGTYGALLQGVRRFRVIQYIEEKEGEVCAEVEYIENIMPNDENIEVQALGRAMKQLVLRAISLSPNIPSEASLFIDHVQDPSYLADLVVPYLSVEFFEKQALLETQDVEVRLRKIHQFLTREIEVLEITQKINSDVKSEFGKQQRKYLVREQMRLLQKELGEIDGKTSSTGGGTTGGASEPQELNERILNSKMSSEARAAVLREVERMGMMQPGAPEYMVSHSYVTWMLDLPWEVYSIEDIDLKKSETILNEDHYGLKKVKRRILEFLAVCALKKSLKGPILLFVGPPGVGKTSLGKSIAKALGRKFVRIALGGVRDEAEIRGHRRTYIGSMPGKIVDSLKKAGTMDPVILFDEIDKLAADGRGDPSSALLEVLDPEQNHTFTDHYLNTPLDLSKVFFVATANNLSSIPSPLRDRMEIIELSSYTLDEKNHIAFEHLLPQVLEDHGLKDVMDVSFDEATMKSLIELYTREAGVRQLKRELAGVVRGITREYVEQTQAKKETTVVDENVKVKIKKRHVKLDDIRKYLGPDIYLHKQRPKVLPVGVSTGLAWTPNGGDVLYIETAKIAPGTGKFALTGQLGDVMKESVQTAFAFIKSNTKLFGVNAKDILKTDLHIHFPEGAVKKDGPSAGIAAFCAIVSQFTGKMLTTDLAMTGEISLRGEVLPVGGVKEKLLAAHRYGIKNVLIPEQNSRDLEDIPKEVLKEMKVTFVSDLAQVYKIAFGPTKTTSKVKNKK